MARDRSAAAGRSQVAADRSGAPGPARAPPAPLGGRGPWAAGAGHGSRSRNRPNVQAQTVRRDQERTRSMIPPTIIWPTNERDQLPIRADSVRTDLAPRSAVRRLIWPSISGFVCAARPRVRAPDERASCRGRVPPRPRQLIRRPIERFRPFSRPNTVPFYGPLERIWPVAATLSRRRHRGSRNPRLVRVTDGWTM